MPQIRHEESPLTRYDLIVPTVVVNAGTPPTPLSHPTYTPREMRTPGRHFTIRPGVRRVPPIDTHLSYSTCYSTSPLRLQPRLRERRHGPRDRSTEPRLGTRLHRPRRGRPSGLERHPRHQRQDRPWHPCRPSGPAGLLHPSGCRNPAQPPSRCHCLPQSHQRQRPEWTWYQPTPTPHRQPDPRDPAALLGLAEP